MLHILLVQFIEYFQIVNSMRNICQTCVKELDIAYSFKLRCDQLNYEGPKITSKRALCEICGQTFKHLASLEQHCSHGRRIVPVDQMHGKKQPKNRGETPKRKRNIEHRIARDSLKFRISVKNEKITPMTRSEKMDKALMDLN